MTHRTPDKPTMIEKSSKLGPLKMTCPACGYTLRIAEKWIQTIGAPACPRHGKMTIHWPQEPRAVAEARLATSLLTTVPAPERLRANLLVKDNVRVCCNSHLRKTLGKCDRVSMPYMRFTRTG
jgi:hypothetical protein